MARHPTSNDQSSAIDRRLARWFTRYAIVKTALGHGPERLMQTHHRTWLTKQRARLGNLTPDQVHALFDLPGFSSEPRTDRWRDHLEEFVAFVDDVGRPPRVRSQDPVERSLANWRVDQERRLRAGRLDEERRTQLEYNWKKLGLM